MNNSNQDPEALQLLSPNDSALDHFERVTGEQFSTSHLVAFNWLAEALFNSAYNIKAEVVEAARRRDRAYVIKTENHNSKYGTRVHSINPQPDSHFRPFRQSVTCLYSKYIPNFVYKQLSKFRAAGFIERDDYYIPAREAEPDSYLKDVGKAYAYSLCVDELQVQQAPIESGNWRAPQHRFGITENCRINNEFVSRLIQKASDIFVDGNDDPIQPTEEQQRLVQNINRLERLPQDVIRQLPLSDQYLLLRTRRIKFGSNTGRFFSVFADTPSYLRKLVAAHNGLVEIDLVSSQPTFLAALSEDRRFIEALKGKGIYETLAERFGLTRDEAKTAFNTLINAATSEALRKSLLESFPNRPALSRTFESTVSQMFPDAFAVIEEGREHTQQTDESLGGHVLSRIEGAVLHQNQGEDYEGIPLHDAAFVPPEQVCTTIETAKRNFKAKFRDVDLSILQFHVHDFTRSTSQPELGTNSELSSSDAERGGSESREEPQAASKH